MIKEFCHENLCKSELAHLAVEGKIFTKNKNIIYEIKVVINNGSMYIVKRSHQDLEELRKALKKYGKERSLKEVIEIQDKIKKLLAKSNILERLEKLFNQLLSIDEVRGSKIIKEFVRPEDWFCSQCSECVESKEVKFNQSVVSEPFHYPKYKVIKNGLPAGLKQPVPALDDVVEVFKKDPSGWWQILYKKKIICFPSSYLKPEIPQSDSDDDPVPLETPEVFVAKKSYEACNGDEISFKEGELLNVIQMRYDGWWMVETEGKSGLAPAVFLEKTTFGELNSRTNPGFSKVQEVGGTFQGLQE